MDLRELVKKYKDLEGQTVNVSGWIRNNRDQKEFGFLELFDGTAFGSIQIVYSDDNTNNFEEISKYRIGSALEIEGEVALTPNAKQPFEIIAKKVVLCADSGEDYPIQPKRHTREFLREKAHLRARTLLFNTVFRVRNELTYAVHKYFQEHGFVNCPSPIITKVDAEGAGEMFGVSVLEHKNPPLDKEGNVDYNKDFFGGKSSLTVTGQLQAEIYAMSFKKTYTFGPTFRAENSNTSKHAAEFWMIEPEIAFADNEENMRIAEDFVKNVISYVLNNCDEELKWLDKFVEKGLIDKLKDVVSKDFLRVTYTQAQEILKNADVEFEFPIGFGNDLASEHEKYLTDIHFNAPVFVTDWPKEMKAFYMRLNSDNKTVAGMDLLVPRVGELIGGSQREERYDHLIKRMKEMNVPRKDLEWYLDLRKYGGCYHSGFGLGFERLVMYVTGIENIRDVHPFPRTPNNCEF
ncbi:MAG: asparagine--tRNA ligase [Bacilli bacterium]